MRRVIWWMLCLSSFAWADPLVLSGKDLVTGKNHKWSVAEDSVIVFLSPTCPCSRSHEKILVDLAKQHPKMRFLGVVSGTKTVNEAMQYFTKAKLPFAILSDPNYEWADALGALNTPHAFVFKNSTRVYRGGVDDSRSAEKASQHYLADVLTALEHGDPVKIAEARAVGCAVRK